MINISCNKYCKHVETVIKIGNIRNAVERRMWYNILVEGYAALRFGCFQKGVYLWQPTKLQIYKRVQLCKKRGPIPFRKLQIFYRLAKAELMRFVESLALKL